MATLKLKNIDKIYDNGVQAVFDFNLEVGDKEFVVFVGPSGCGKSTTLRMIAGLEEISAGEFYIDDILMNNVQPKDRDIAMVFQSYALYPHMTVKENMAFALKLRKIPKPEIEERVQEAAKILGLTQYLDRQPKALSGGQRQRVALGRAIVRHPKVFLMDEPLSNLDAKLRVSMRSEIIKIHERVGATTVYVTHDQTEAMTMATRIVVMKDGRIQQIGAPKELYNNPNNKFVAGFIGSPAMNFVQGTIVNGSFIVDGEKGISYKLDKEQVKLIKPFEGRPLLLGVRPEDIKYEHSSSFDPNGFVLTVEAEVVELLGDILNVHATIDGQPVVIKTDSKHDIISHDIIKVSFLPPKVHFFDVTSEINLSKVEDPVAHNAQYPVEVKTEPSSEE
ncbi:MAG: sn-glycerol-3-phosphate ABC transporter ATP-binding protein UgpC [Bacillales bacterium]|jgi:multiple sugar transport system ATP-binding protein|nr:sn-glycerol-3-phosphate ABC transporter ATP-binding protein UgpC [Bacillales bacterium]